MTNLLNVLKTMETETTGVKNDVINFLLAQSQDSEDAEGILDNILTHGCESGMVNHLIYYTDTVAYYEEHKSEIMEMLEQLGIENVEGSEGIDELSNIFHVDDFETRMNAHDIYDKAIEIVADNNDITEDELNEFIDDYEEEVFEERYYLATELDTQDKNYLAWAIFEHNASVLLDELDEMELID